jgi:hypothetical protein
VTQHRIIIGDQFARAAYYGRYKVIPIRTEIIKFCETIGLDYLGAIIWKKVTTCNTSGGATIMGSFPFPRNGIVKLDYEFILIFKKPGRTPPPSPAAKEQSRLSIDRWTRKSGMMAPRSPSRPQAPGRGRGRRMPEMTVGVFAGACPDSGGTGRSG